jgi:hypothetical protein
MEPGKGVVFLSPVGQQENHDEKIFFVAVHPIISHLLERRVRNG